MKRVVLVVDDDPSVLRVVARVLRGRGCEVLVAGSGSEALQRIADHAGSVNLLLTDVVMPNMGGKALSEALASRFPDLKVVFMSGYTADEALLEGIRRGAAHFIAKPFGAAALWDLVDRLLG